MNLHFPCAQCYPQFMHNTQQIDDRHSARMNLLNSFETLNPKMTWVLLMCVNEKYSLISVVILKMTTKVHPQSLDTSSMGQISHIYDQDNSKLLIYNDKKMFTWSSFFPILSCFFLKPCTPHEIYYYVNVHILICSKLYITRSQVPC